MHTRSHLYTAANQKIQLYLIMLHIQLMWPEDARVLIEKINYTETRIIIIPYIWTCYRF